MPRPKKYPDAEKTINAFFASVSDAYNHPAASECEHPTPATSTEHSREEGGAHKTQALLAEEFGISRLKVRKILITTGDLHYPETTRIHRLLKSGKSKKDACAELEIAISTLNSFLPYEKGVYNLTDVSIYAESSRVYRERKEAVANLAYAIQYGTFEEQSYQLWKTITLFQGYPFTTSGRGSREGTKFKYQVSAPGEKGGRHYEGTSVDGFGNELWVIRNGQRAEKSISRSSVDYALKITLEARNLGESITGPKQLGVFGSSYTFALFRRFGLV